MILPIQALLLIFLFFAISRVYLRARSGRFKFGEMLFWISLFAVAIVGVIDPEFTTYIASKLGIGRGTDVVVYISIVLLFYLIFRLNVMLEETKHQVTRLIREIALQEYEKDTLKKSKKIKA